MPDEQKFHSPELIEYRIRQVELKVDAVEDRLSTLATKEDVAALQASIARKNEWWNNSIFGPTIVGIVLIVAEIWLKR